MVGDEFHRDNRGLTMAFVKLLAALGVGAAIIWVTTDTAVPMLDDAKTLAPGGMGGIKMNDWFRTGIEIVLPVMFMLVSFFGFIARAVYERGAAK